VKTPVIVTDLTRMQDQRICLAGYLSDDTCVRPIFRSGHLMEDWLRVKGQVVVRPFALVEFDLHKNTPHPPHSEDWVIDSHHRIQRGMLTAEQRRQFLSRIADESVASIFGAGLSYEMGWYVMAGHGKRSLGTIWPKHGWEVSYTLRGMGKWDYRITFTDPANQRYNLSVTDLAFRYLLDTWRVREKLSPTKAAQRLTGLLQQAEVVLRIGMARGWEKHPDRCYVQCTGVYSFPDYLEGRCFADLALSPKELAAAMYA
jgi:hypothetical protein